MSAVTADSSTAAMTGADSKATQHIPTSVRDETTQRKPTKQSKKKPGTIKAYLFDNHIIPILEEHGWICSAKERRKKPTEAGAASSPPPAHIDRLFIPPGVKTAKPFKIRKDYFDSRQQVLSSLQHKPDKYGKEMSSYVLRFVDSIDDILKRERTGEFRVLEEAGGDDMETRAERILAVSAEEALLETLEESIRSTSSRVEGSKQFAISASKRLPKYVEDSCIPIFTPDVINSDILGRVLAENGLTDAISLDDGSPLPEVKVTDVPDDPRSVELHLIGRKELVDDLKGAVIDAINKAKRKYEDEQNTSSKETSNVSSEKNAEEKGAVIDATHKALRKHTDEQKTSSKEASNVSSEKITKEKGAVIDVTEKAIRSHTNEQKTSSKETSNVSSEKSTKKSRDSNHHSDDTDYLTSDVKEPEQTLTREETKHRESKSSTNFVKVSKKLPKFVGNTLRVIFTSAKVDGRIVRQILLDTGQKEEFIVLDTGERFPLLEAAVRDIPSEPYSVQLLVRGRMDLVQMAKNKLCNWINAETAQYNLHTLLTDGSSLEIDLYFDAGPSSMSIMGDVVDITELLNNDESETTAKRHHEGLWIKSKVQPGSQMSSIVGDAMNQGGAVLSVGGIKVSTFSDLQQAWKKAEQDAILANKNADGGKPGDHSELHITSCPKIVITICVGKNADLGKIDTSRVVRAKGNPRRRDGGVYRGKHNFGSAVAIQRKTKVATSTTISSQANKDPKMPDSSVASAKLSAVKTTAHTSSAARQSYRDFMEKYRSVRDIEYNLMGINGHQVTKSMWEQHKLIYGNSCDDNCSCPSDLKRLTETVIPDFLKKQAEKKTASNDQQSRVGFVDQFVPKFYEKVRAEFPDCTPVQVLEKLVAMWPRHKETIRFGIKCSSNCPCIEGWEVIFLDKCLRPKATEKSGQKHSSSHKKMSFIGTKLGHDTGILDKPSLNRKISGGGSSALQQRREFPISFDPLAPLGFYCITERKSPPASGTVCKITSVDPNAEKRDTRIQPGTIVVASSLVKTTITVSDKSYLHTHIDLKKRYEAAKTVRGFTKIRLWFTNTDVKPTSASDSTGPSAASMKQIPVMNDWTKKGAWQGKSNVPGWPGGAALHKSLGSTLPLPPEDKHSRQSQKIASRNPPRMTLDQEHLNPKEMYALPSSSVPGQAVLSQGDVPKKTSSNSLENEQKAISMAASRRQTKEPGPSLLKRRGGNMAQEHRKVRFSVHLNETKYFEPDTETVGIILGNSRREEFPSPSPVARSETTVVRDEKRQRIKSNHDLIQTILYKDYKKVVQLLKARDYENLTATDSKNKAPLDLVSERLLSLQSDRENNTNVDACKSLDILIQDFNLKKKALKIFILAKHVIGIAKNLKHWVAVELIPHQIKHLQLSNQGRHHRSTEFLFCLVRIDGKKENDIPLTPFAEFIDFSSINSCPKYVVAYNKELDFTLQKRREVVVNVIKGNSTTQGENVKLGTWSETIENIRRSAESFGGNIVEGHLRKSDFLSSGSFSMQVRKYPLDAKFIQSKRTEIARQLSELANWISMFQEETSDDCQGGPILDASISFQITGELSLLHAAVYAADLKLVNRLLSLGADPNAGSEVGSAKILAFNLADKTKDGADEETHNTFVTIRRKLSSCVLEDGNAVRERPFNIELNDSIYHGRPSDGNDQTNSEQHSVNLEATETKRLSKNIAQSHSSYYAKGPEPAPYQPQKLPSHAGSESRSKESSFDDKYTKNTASTNNFSSTIPQEDLPILSTPDWIDGRNLRCPFFNKAGGCRFGKKCFKAHCLPPVGLALDDSSTVDQAFALKSDGWDRSYVHFKEGHDKSSRIWHTAAYFDPVENHIFYVERGDFSYQSRQGIYWYRSRDDALEALKRVWAIITPAGSVSDQVDESKKRHSLQHLHSLQPAAKKARIDYMDGSLWVAELPQLPNVNWLEGKSTKCIWFGSTAGCRFGKKCIKAHVFSPPGSILDNFSISPDIGPKKREQIFNKKFIHTKELVDSAGRKWYTAAFYNTSENIIIYAKQGHSSRQNSQGVYLYPSSQEAINALESSVFASALAMRDQLGGQMNSSSQQSNSENDNTGNPELFSRIMKANLQNIYVKIFPSNTLPRSCWDISSTKEGLVSAKFHSPAKSDNGATYLSCGNGGVYEKGFWWYKDERSAKASAFTLFLKKAAERGLVSQDMTKTSTGNDLFK